MAKKKRSVEQQSIDPAAQQMLIRADELGLGTAFHRADDMAPCNIGASGMCCKLCGMGPCRLTKDGQTGVCGATIDTIQARNLIRAIAAGSAAHSDHGRDMAFTLKAVANGEAEGYVIRDVAKLRIVAANYDIPIEGRAPEEIANDLADLYTAQFGQQRGQLAPVTQAPAKRQQLWAEGGVVPRGVDREVVEALHRTHIGDDQEAEHILQHAMRTALADGWGGSMIATDISDILFGTPAPILGQANLGVLRDDMVNVVVHGHEPTLSEMIVAASQDPEIIEYAQAVPLAYAIDPHTCIGCGLCENVCLASAIDYSDQMRETELNVGSIILSAGSEGYDPSGLDFLGYGKSPNVVTSEEFERILSASGPYRGHLMRPLDREEPARIAWLQCVGSRDINRCDNDYCSAVCCMYAVKQAVMARDHSATSLDCAIFYMDMRTQGKDFDRYYENAKAESIRFIRSRVHSIIPLHDSHDLLLRYLQ